MDCEKIMGKKILSASPVQDREYEVKTYDFTRPDKFSKEQIRTVSIIHETFARFATLTISNYLRMQVHMHVAAVDQLNYMEFLRSISNPATMALLNLSPLEGLAVLEIEPKISSMMIDRSFGGKGESKKENNELSEIERAMMEIISGQLMGNLKDAWCDVIDLNPTLGQIETNPQFAMIVPPMEMVILVSFEISIGDVCGFMNLCIPFLTIEPILGKLSAQFWHSLVRKNEKKMISSQMISHMKMDSEILTRTEDLSLQRLGLLKKGSLINLKGFSKGLSSIRMGGEIVCSSRFNRTKKNITYTIDGEKDLLPHEIQELLRDKKKESDQNDFQENIKKLSLQITNVSTDISRRIEELSNSQDHLNDQVFLQANPDQNRLVLEEQPFSYIGLADLSNLYQLLAHDNPQLIAIILSYLKSEVGARFLEMFSPEIQPDLIRRIGELDRTNPAVLKKIEDILRYSLSKMNENSNMGAGGVDKISEILNLISRTVEKNVIMKLEKTNNELVEEIKNRMFVFEDIILLDKDTVCRIIERADFSDLCLSLKVVDEKVKSYIFDQISMDEKKKIIKGIEKFGRVKISDIDKAQLRIVSLIREMEENGEIIVCCPDELAE
ncbi:MAG: flagellar motor switch protein FliM [Spirochaetaceae bacterium]|nr:flagellar motor switch protein FliM [Spirochaetaceae bacterium]